MIGSTLGHYRIIRKLGDRGGEVYVAHDERLDRDVALELLRVSPTMDEVSRARIRSEARAASALEHPNIAAIYEVDESDGRTYVSMEHVEGAPLRARIGEGGLPAKDVHRYGIQIADALTHAHEQGVAHRHLNRASVVITSEGAAKILDFGLPGPLTEAELLQAIRLQDSLEGTLGEVLPYVSPEILRGNPPDTRSDLWSLGVLLYEMVSGHTPFKGRTAYELGSSILHESAVPLPENVEEPLRSVIERSLGKIPKRRYQWAIEVLAALRGG